MIAAETLATLDTPSGSAHTSEVKIDGNALTIALQKRVAN